MKGLRTDAADDLKNHPAEASYQLAVLAQGPYLVWSKQLLAEIHPVLDRTDRRILSLIHLFTLQGLVLAASTTTMAYFTGQPHLYWSAAITLVLHALLEPGDRLVVPHDGYGGSWRLFNALAEAQNKHQIGNHLIRQITQPGTPGQQPRPDRFDTAPQR